MSHKSTRLTYKSCLAALIGVLAGTAVHGAPAQDAALPGTSPVLATRVDVRNRFKSFSGNEDVYRSMFDLGEGPKLYDFSSTYRASRSNGSSVLPSEVSLRATGWGGEPAATLRFTASRESHYDLSFNYRKVDFFSSLPSFANPTAARSGATQSAYDVTRRLFDFSFAYRPAAAVSPFFTFERDSSTGPGRTTFVQDANEYAVATTLDNATSTFRGGVRLNFDRWSGQFEAGGSIFHDDQNVAVQGPNLGNRTTLFLGQRLQLDGLQQRYDVSGRDRFVRGLLEFRPIDKLTLNGRFSFSQPSVTAGYTHEAEGRFILLTTLQTVTREQLVSQTTATWPHPSGSVGVEFRPIRRVRIVDTVSTDRFHVAGGGGTLAANFTRNKLDASVELTDIVTLHGGHGYLRADAQSPGSVLAAPETRNLERHEGVIGAGLRWGSRARLNIDLEAEDGDDVFFRQDRRSRKRAVLRGRYRVIDSLDLGLSGSLWNNDNRSSDIDFSERSREISADVAFVPGGGRIVSVFAGYTRGTFSSDLPFIVPQNFQVQRSLYRDRGHSGSLNVTVHPFPRAEIQAGGTLFLSTASPLVASQTRATRLYKTRSQFSFQMLEWASWVADWTWHEYSHRTFRREDFRVHLVSTGVQFEF